jgi:hypothetical protein
MAKELKLKKHDKVQIKKKEILEKQKVKELTGTIFKLFNKYTVSPFYLVRDDNKRNSHLLEENEVRLIKDNG